MSEQDPDFDLVEQIYDALDDGRPEVALELAGRALAGTDDADPVLHFLAGVALIELERADEAAESLARAVELDPDDAEFRANLALALFRDLRFEDAEASARRATELDPRLPDAHHVLGLALEHGGRYADADVAFARAHRLDPDQFPEVRRLAREAFERHLADAMAELPEIFRAHLDAVAVTVEPLPPRAILEEDEPPLDPELLGLFVGTAITERATLGAAAELPPRIFLFQRNLERWASEPGSLVDEIGVTLRHELGHYLGMDEDQIERAGHA